MRPVHFVLFVILFCFPLVAQAQDGVKVDEQPASQPTEDEERNLLGDSDVPRPGPTMLVMPKSKEQIEAEEFADAFTDLLFSLRQHDDRQYKEAVEKVDMALELLTENCSKEQLAELNRLRNALGEVLVHYQHARKSLKRLAGKQVDAPNSAANFVRLVGPVLQAGLSNKLFSDRFESFRFVINDEPTKINLQLEGLQIARLRRFNTLKAFTVYGDHGARRLSFNAEGGEGIRLLLLQFYNSTGTRVAEILCAAESAPQYMKIPKSTERLEITLYSVEKELPDQEWKATAKSMQLLNVHKE